MTRVTLPDTFLKLPIAHRALHDRAQGRIENSAQAVKAAVAAGYGIEVDLQLSSDGVPMVFHDEALDRLTEESGPIITRTAADLGRIRLKGSADTIPTLPLSSTPGTPTTPFRTSTITPTTFRPFSLLSRGERFPTTSH